MSASYGYSVILPLGWTARQARTVWDGTAGLNYQSNEVDLFTGPASASSFGAAVPWPKGLDAFVTSVIVNDGRFHADTCPATRPQTRTAITIGTTAGVLLVYNCGILINIAVTVQDAVGYRFTFRDSGVTTATDPADRATFLRILHSVRFATTPTRSTFLARVDQICLRAVQAHASHPFPLASFDPEHPDAAQLPAVGTYFARYRGLAQTTSALHGLEPPARDATAWRALLGDVDRINANAQRQIAAARAKDVTTFVATFHAGQRLTDQLNAAGEDFGFVPSSACGQVFG